VTGSKALTKIFLSHDSTLQQNIGYIAIESTLSINGVHVSNVTVYEGNKAAVLVIHFHTATSIPFSRHQEAGGTAFFLLKSNETTFPRVPLEFKRRLAYNPLDGRFEMTVIAGSRVWSGTDVKRQEGKRTNEKQVTFSFPSSVPKVEIDKSTYRTESPRHRYLWSPRVDANTS